VIFPCQGSGAGTYWRYHLKRELARRIGSGHLTYNLGQETEIVTIVDGYRCGGIEGRDLTDPDMRRR